MGRLYIDIDGTIATSNVPHLTQLINATLRLNIADPEHYSFAEFCSLPEMTAYRERLGEEQYQTNLKLFLLHPQQMQEMLVIEPSAHVLRALARSKHEVRYLTARKSNVEGWNQAAERATKFWLRKHEFPEPEQVIFAAGPRGKLIYLAREILSSGEACVLIDDMHEKLTKEVSQLSREAQKALTKLAIRQPDWSRFMNDPYLSSDDPEEEPTPYDPFDPDNPVSPGIKLEDTDPALPVIPDTPPLQQ